MWHPVLSCHYYVRVNYLWWWSHFVIYSDLSSFFRWCHADKVWILLNLLLTHRYMYLRNKLLFTIGLGCVPVNEGGQKFSSRSYWSNPSYTAINTNRVLRALSSTCVTFYPLVLKSLALMIGSTTLRLCFYLPNGPKWTMDAMMMEKLKLNRLIFRTNRIFFQTNQTAIVGDKFGYAILSGCLF